MTPYLGSPASSVATFHSSEIRIWGWHWTKCWFFQKPIWCGQVSEGTLPTNCSDPGLPELGCGGLGRETSCVSLCACLQVPFQERAPFSSQSPGPGLGRQLIAEKMASVRAGPRVDVVPAGFRGPQGRSCVPGRFLLQRPFQRCFLLHLDPTIPFSWGLDQAPGHQEYIANFLLVVSPWEDWKIQHSHSHPGPAAAAAAAAAGLGLVWEKKPADFTSLPPSSPVLCSDPHSSPHPFPAPTFLIFSIIKWPRVLWDPLILFAVLYWGN